MNARTTMRISAALLLASIAACAHADVLNPAAPAASAEDYAVWGAALDLEVGGTREAEWPVLLADVATPNRDDDGFARRGARRFMARYPIDDAMIEAFYSPDSAAARVSPAVLGRHTRVRIAGVRRAGADPMA